MISTLEKALYAGSIIVLIKDVV